MFFLYYYYYYFTLGRLQLDILKLSRLRAHSALHISVRTHQHNSISEYFCPVRHKSISEIMLGDGTWGTSDIPVHSKCVHNSFGKPSWTSWKETSCHIANVLLIYFPFYLFLPKKQVQRNVWRAVWVSHKLRSKCIKSNSVMCID